MVDLATPVVTGCASKCKLILQVTSAKEVMFSPVSIGLCVGLSAALHKNYWTDFHETWMADGSRPKNRL